MTLNSNNDMVREIKGLKKGALNNFKLTFSGSSGNILGWFSPITVNSLSDDTVIQKITEWRSIHRASFFTQFEPTEDKTRNWLKENVLLDDTRILFIIYNAEGTPIGNYGLRDIHDTQAELDNLLIGDSTSTGPLVLIAIKTFLNWIFSQFGFKVITASIFKQNLTTILIHKRLGFKVTREIPVKKVVRGDVIQFIRDKNADSPNAYIVEMAICQSERELQQK